MVFILDKDLNIDESNTYIEHECLATTKKDKNKFAIRDCNTTNFYGCTNTSAEFARLSWYDYQEKCLQEGNFVVYNRNTIGKTAKDEPYWTPMFRSHTVVTGKLSGKEVSLALTKEKTKHFTAENCSLQFPFLCSGSLVVAVILCVIILILSMIITSIKAFRRVRIYQEKLKMVNERLPGTEFSNYTGIEDANEDVHNSAYQELSENVSPLRKQRQEGEIDTSEDPVDYQGYLVPEQHYHTIPEVEVHYAAADVAERNSNKENVDIIVMTI